MTTDRANEIYAAHVASGNMIRKEIAQFVTAEEGKEINERWGKLPGSTCWNDAFFTFMSNDKLPPYMMRRVPALRNLLK